MLQLPPAELHLSDQATVFSNQSNWDWLSSRRAHYTLWIAISGNGSFRIEDTHFNLQPGFAVLLPPLTRVYARNTSSTKPSNIALHFHFTAHEEAWQELLKEPTIIRNLPLIWELAAYIDRFYGPLDINDDRPELEMIAAQILRIYARNHFMGPEDPTDNRIRAQISRLRQSPASFNSVEALAREIPLSVPHYTRRFKSMTGLPPAKFLIQERINQASRLLRESTLSIEAISDALGYRDISFFSRQFKSRHGISPLSFRKATGT